MLRMRHAHRRESVSLSNPFVDSIRVADWLVVAVLATITAAILTTEAYAQSPTVEFDIPAQPVSSALRSYARQAGVNVLVVTEMLDSIEANAVVGSYNPQSALQILLAGTGLHAQYRPDATVAVGRASDVSVQPVGSVDSSETLSNLVAQAAVQTDERVVDTGTARTLENSASEDAEEAIREIEEILVTGSRIRGAQSASPIVSITRQEIDQAGFATVEEVVENLPQNFGAGTSLDASTDIANNSNVVGGTVTSVPGGTSVNLRGLGASSTLVLLNGRRLSPSGFGAGFTNISRIPVTAIERVEVMTDGASAIYGSDAIGGVINFILRDNYDGVETRLRYGSDGRGDTSNIQFGQSLGKSWDDGSVLLSYEYYDSDSLANRDRPYTASSDLTRFGGTDRRTPGGSPANVDAGGQLWAIPVGQDGTSLTAADFPADAAGAPLASPNVYNNRLNGDVLPELQRHSVFLNLNQEVGSVGLFAQALYSTQESEYRTAPRTQTFDVTDANPFFVDPTGTGLTTIQIENHSFQDDFDSSRFGEFDSWSGTIGARFDMGENWHGELAGNWSREEDATGIINGLDLTALDLAVNPANPGDPVFNPFADGPAANPTILDSFVIPRRLEDETENEIRNFTLNIDGTITELPGGALRVAAGAEFRDESIVSTTFLRGNRETTDLDRDVTAFYAELFFPLVSDSNSRRGFEQLELSIAARYEDYSDFGDTANPKVGIVWAPTHSFKLRGTWGTSFRAPALRDLSVSDLNTNTAFAVSQFFVDIGLVPFPFIARIGGSEDLQPEEAATWTAGFEWSPKDVPGLSLDVTYFNVDFEDRIDTPVASLTAVDDPRFRTLVTMNPTDDQLAALVNDPRWDETFGVTAADVLSGAANVQAIFDVRRANLSRSVVTGVEVQFAYQFDTTLGSFNLGLNGNYLFDFERAFIEGDPLEDEVDTFGRPIDFQARGNVTWNRDEWSVSGFVNYADGYTDNISVPSRSVDSWTTVDLTIAYDTGDTSGFFRNTRLSLTTQNLLDEDPPFVDTEFGLGYDSTNANPIGRFLALQIAKEW